MIVVCHGNSLTFGGGLVTAYPPVMATFLASFNHGTYTVHNRGTDGLQTPAMTSEYASVVATLSPDVVIAQEGGNHMKIGLATPQQAYDAMRAYCLAATAPVYVCTTTPRNEAIQTSIAAYNVLIRANWQTFAAKLVDLAAVAALSDPTNLTYFQGDGTHLTAAGYSAMSDAVADKVRPDSIAQRARNIAAYGRFMARDLSGAISASRLTDTYVNGEISLSWT